MTSVNQIIERPTEESVSFSPSPKKTQDKLDINRSPDRIYKLASNVNKPK